MTPGIKTDLLDQLLGRERILIGDIFLIKVLQGFRRQTGLAARRDGHRAYVSFLIGCNDQMSSERSILRAICFTACELSRSSV